MFLSKVLIRLCMIMHYIVEETFCRYCLQALSTEEILKRHIKDCFKINEKQRIMMSKEANMLNSNKEL